MDSNNVTIVIIRLVVRLCKTFSIGRSFGRHFWEKTISLRNKLGNQTE